MALSLGGALAELLRANDKNPRKVSCTLSPRATEEIVNDFTRAVRSEIVAGGQSRLTPFELQQLKLG